MRNIPVLGAALAAGGVVFVWSGLHGANITSSLRDVLAGKSPTPPPGAATAAAAVSSGVPAGGASGAAGAVASTASQAANRTNAQLQAAGYGWIGAQWTALENLWDRESGFNNLAQNPSSTAYGIAQFLDSTWAGYGPKTSDPTLQIRYGLEYIHGRYGNPVAAWAHETSAGWY